MATIFGDVQYTQNGTFTNPCTCCFNSAMMASRQLEVRPSDLHKGLQASAFRIGAIGLRNTQNTQQPMVLKDVQVQDCTSIWVCYWKCCVPLCTQWFSWSLSLWKMAISLGILTQHFQTNPYVWRIWRHVETGQEWSKNVDLETESATWSKCTAEICGLNICLT